MRYDEVRVTAIDTGGRSVDREFLPRLIESIRVIGLLSPIGVGPDHTLYYGAHRLAAVVELGWERVPVVVIDTVQDRLDYLKIERDENAVRRVLKPTEEAALYEEILEVERSEAAKRMSDGGKGAKVSHPSTLPKRAKAEAAKAATGAPGRARTLDKVLDVQRAVISDETPEPVREVAREALREIDSTGKVDAGHKKVKNALTAAEAVAEFPDLAYYFDKGDHEQAAKLGNALRGYDEPERSMRLNNLRLSIEADKRKAERPAQPTGPDYVKLADGIFVAVNEALQVIEKNGGADTIRNAVPNMNPLSLDLLRENLTRISEVATDLKTATRPALRRVQ